MRESAQTPSSTDVVLVVPPARLLFPAIGVDQLAGILRADGVSVAVHYANVEFAKRWGRPLQLFLAEPGGVYADIMFSILLFDVDADRRRRIAELTRQRGEVLRMLMPSLSSEAILDAFVRMARELGETMVERIVAAAPRILGLSSSMYETPFCVWVAREVKRRLPGVRTAFGGANSNGEMGQEVFRLFKEFDYVCQEEADVSFPILVKEILEKGRLSRNVAGVLSREFEAEPPIPPLPVSGPELDAMAFADHSDYFEQISDLPFPDGPQVPNMIRGRIVPMETSRGCWWAQKNFCTFCGLNPNNGGSFRTRSAERVVKEFEYQVKLHRPAHIQFVDNLPNYSVWFKGFLPNVQSESGPTIFVELTGNLRRRYVDLMAGAKVADVQPGMESLSDGALKLMLKPTTSAHNIQTLRLFSERGINCAWNYLYGVPGEKIEEEWPKLSELFRKLHHLQPPVDVSKIQLQRYSPFYNEPEKYGLTGRELPELLPLYMPLPEASLKQLSYFFDHKFFSDIPKSQAWAEMGGMVSRWKSSHWRSHLVYVPRKVGGLLLDTRQDRKRLVRTLSAVERAIIEYCDQTRTAADVRKRFPAKEAEEALARLVDDAIVLDHSGQYLTLAVFPQRGYRPLAVDTTLVSIAVTTSAEMLKTGRAFGLRGGALVGMLQRLGVAKVYGGFHVLREQLVEGAVRRIAGLLAEGTPWSAGAEAAEGTEGAAKSAPAGTSGQKKGLSVLQ